MKIYVFVKSADADLVRKDTAFWRAGGISVSMAQGLNVDLPPLQTVISGAIAFNTPQVIASSAAGPDTGFPLYGNRDAAKAAAGGASFTYFREFTKGVGGLASGAPVTFGGRGIGRVENVGRPTEKGSGDVATPVEITIDALALEVRVVLQRPGRSCTKSWIKSSQN